MRINKLFSQQQKMPQLIAQTGHLTFLAFLLLSISQTAFAQSPIEWLERMQKAVHTLDYEGRFVYQAGSHIESMYVVHRVHAQGELERLVALDGEHREVIRGNNAIAFIKPGHHPINIQETPNQYALSLKHKLDYQQLVAHYKIELGEQNRVAGRSAQVIEIQPRDHLRYGHRLYLDQATALPLRSVLLDVQGQSLSQNLFVELRVGPGVTPIEYDLSALSHTYPPQKSAPQARQSANQWLFATLPDGYQQKAYRYQATEQREHFIFSDGLSAVSLYIEQEQQNKRPINGHSSMGATQMLALEKYGRQITLIGEAPISALNKLAEALRQHD